MRIMLATDGSKAAQAATAYLKELPLPPSTTLRITAVVTLPALAIEAASVRDFKRTALDEARRLVEATRATLAPRGYPIETDVAVGDPRVEIVRQAEEWGADLIVLGARGLGMFKRLLLGSVSLAIARQARCSVLVVKGRPRKFGSVLVAMDGSEESFQAVRFLHSLRAAAADARCGSSAWSSGSATRPPRRARCAGSSSRCSRSSRRSAAESSTRCSSAPPPSWMTRSRA